MITVEQMYRAMATQSLLDLQAGFRIDLTNGGADLAFVSHRLQLLAHELDRRAQEEARQPIRQDDVEGGQ